VRLVSGLDELAAAAEAFVRAHAKLNAPHCGEVLVDSVVAAVVAGDITVAEGISWLDAVERKRRN
jgi:hypothetical protein